MRTPGLVAVVVGLVLAGCDGCERRAAARQARGAAEASDARVERARLVSVETAGLRPLEPALRLFVTRAEVVLDDASAVQRWPAEALVARRRDGAPTVGNTAELALVDGGFSTADVSADAFDVPRLHRAFADAWAREERARPPVPAVPGGDDGAERRLLLVVDEDVPMRLVAQVVFTAAQVGSWRFAIAARGPGAIGQVPLRTGDGCDGRIGGGGDAQSTCSLPELHVASTGVMVAGVPGFTGSACLPAVLPRRVRLARADLLAALASTDAGFVLEAPALGEPLDAGQPQAPGTPWWFEQAFVLAPEECPLQPFGTDDGVLRLLATVEAVQRLAPGCVRSRVSLSPALRWGQVVPLLVALEGTDDAKPVVTLEPLGDRLRPCDGVLVLDGDGGVVGGAPERSEGP